MNRPKIFDYPNSDISYEECQRRYLDKLESYCDELEDKLNSLVLKLEKQQELCSFKYTVLTQKALDKACEYISNLKDGNPKNANYWKHKFLEEVQDE